MSQNGKLMPNLDQNSTKLLNLTVLQRIDPFVEEILITAAHVTFYEFNIDNNQWSRKDVEGSLFVVKRNTQPRFQFIVMNRRNTDNLVENLLEDFEFEIQVPYLLYRNAAQEVNGIWFYNSRECEEVANLFTRLLNAYSKVPTKSKVSPSKSEFEELEAVPTMAVMDGPLEPSVTTSNVAEVPDDPSFVNFFSTALNIGNASNSTMGGQPYGSSTMIQPSHPQGVVPPMMQPSHPQGVLPPMMQPSHTQGVLPPMMQPSHTQGVLPPMMQPSHPQGVVPPTIEKMQAPPPPLSTSTPLMPQNNEVNSDIKPSTNLVKPSTLFTPPSSLALMMPPISSSVPTAPPLNPPGNLQRPYGAPLLQPFPPPNPPLSLTPATAPTPNLAFITREKIREALLVLVQDDQFIDMVYRAVMNTHSS